MRLISCPALCMKEMPARCSPGMMQRSHDVVGRCSPSMFEWLTHVIRPRLGPPEEPSRRSLKPSTLKKSFMILRFWPAPFPSCSKFWAADRCRFRCDGRFEERRVLGKARRAAAVKSLTVVSFELFGGYACDAENWNTWLGDDMSPSAGVPSI
ncbi:hypothetical protein HBI56_191680 [Parastagonospora nodorum]|nr:hypothetical protein HBH54_091160 [Parastagonospora nodorum]KAH3996154.1 hypothetical protein HBI10_161340 [Parastagonospora nodorum]KAH4019507.1 hypothetical protein HBI13_125700 [Parastagonospora nodorum]KAH4152571.1 hypothetical protein HBH44_160970 [Parastagonospora nodorum]KAH4192927.1 hypothetical protein HBI95_206730 [Parastagonospora nodorum]